MRKRYNQSGCKKSVYRRRTGKMQMAAFISLILLIFIMVIVFACKTGFANEKSPQLLEPSEPLEISDVDASWYLTLVNEQNPIPSNYKPDLIEIQGGERVDKHIYEPLMEMLEDAKEANWNQLPRVVSGYRTSDVQQGLYDDKVADYRKEGCSEIEAQELAKQWVAVPGYSEHQLGFAVDINGASYDVYLWLQENSYKYGFIFRYPGNKTEITGVAEEVWHYRYVGAKAAAEMYEQGLCLEEYLETI